VLHCR